MKKKLKTNSHQNLGQKWIRERSRKRSNFSCAFFFDIYQNAAHRDSHVASDKYGKVDYKSTMHANYFKSAPCLWKLRKIKLVQSKPTRENLQADADSSRETNDYHDGFSASATVCLLTNVSSWLFLLYYVTWCNTVELENSINFDV